MISLTIRTTFPLMILLTMGCGSNAMTEGVKYAKSDEAIYADAEDHSGGETGEVADEKPAEHAIDRRIIYTAEVGLVVNDFEKLEMELPKLVEETGGFVADVSIDRTSGQNRFGSWQARIPVAKFNEFLEAVDRLGIPESHNQTAQDVTEEYVDLEARIANKKKLEERILDLLESSDGRIKDVIEVERELARVRSEIEQMEGRLRYLKNRIALTTVTISAREQRDYTPPTAPTFLTRLSDSWMESIETLQRALEDSTIGLISAVPWLVLFGIGFYLFYRFARWIWKRRESISR